MKTPVVLFLFVCVLVSAATPASAQDDGSGWYAGAGAGRLNTDFRPYYTYYAGGTPDQFENEAHGLQLEFLAGRRHRLSNRWSISLEASAAFNSFEWSLSIPEEPAELEYSLPYRVALSVVPEAHFGRLSVYAGVGGGVGRVHQVKTSPSSSTYDIDRVRPTLNLAGGVRVRMSSAWSAFAHLGHVRYAKVETDTFTPANVRIEHVTDKPRATGFTVGIIKRF